MENATKLMLMAAGILITVLIASMGIYNARRLDVVADVYQSRVHQLNVKKYNANFESFIDDDIQESNITAQEIVSLLNFTQNNENYTEIYVDGINMSYYQAQEKRDFLKNNACHSLFMNTINQALLGREVKGEWQCMRKGV